MTELKYIADNVHKLLSDCQDKETYTPPSFTTSTDIEALIVLNQIVKIASEYRLYPKDIKHVIELETLQRIIHIKCKEFCERPIDSSRHVFGTSTSTSFGQKPSFVFGANNYSSSSTNYSSSSTNYSSSSTNFGVNNTTNALQQTPDVEKFKTSLYSFINTLVEDFLQRIN